MSPPRYTSRRWSATLIAGLALALLLCSTIAHAESIAVIVNKKNLSEPLPQTAVAGMYRGETINWQNGERVKLVNREISAPVRRQFYEHVLNAKSDQVFYRQGTPIPVQSVIEQIVMTAKDSSETRQASEAAGADAYFSKPFPFEDLLRAIIRLHESYVGSDSLKGTRAG
ncbi:MAG: hypothetical protein CAF44_010350 [Nitrospira sp. CG24D]|nr:MAG: hypothetical protein CAF44_010350 [Nitrospira sp. CG24D]